MLNLHSLQFDKLNDQKHIEISVESIETTNILSESKVLVSCIHNTWFSS